MKSRQIVGKEKAREIKEAWHVLLDYLWAIMQAAGAIASRGALIVSIAVGALTFLAFITLAIVLGDRALGGKAFLSLGISIRGPSAGSTYIVEHAPLVKGHLCAVWVEVAPGDNVMALDENGISQHSYHCPTYPVAAAVCGACTKVVQGSDSDNLAALRRQIIKWHIRDVASESIVYPSLFASLFAFLAAFSVVFVPSFLARVFGALFRLLRIVRRTAFPPTLDVWLEQDLPPESVAVLGQLSDLHMTCRGLVPYELMDVKGAPNSDELFRRTIEVVKATEAQTAFLALTGDLTDSGHQEEWNGLREALHSSQRQIFFPIPGNHDIQIVIEIGSDGGRTAPSRRSSPIIDQRKRCADNLEAISGSRSTFPAISKINGGGNGVIVLAIDSTHYDSNWLLSNAVGHIGPGQLNRVDEILAQQSLPIIVTLHHHVGRYATHQREIRDVLMCAIDGRGLLESLAKYSSRTHAPVLVLHGHKHMMLRGTYRAHGAIVHVHGAPSSTLGAVYPGSAYPDSILRTVIVYFDGTNWEVQIKPIP